MTYVFFTYTDGLDICNNYFIKSTFISDASYDFTIYFIIYNFYVNYFIFLSGVYTVVAVTGFLILFDVIPVLLEEAVWISDFLACWTTGFFFGYSFFTYYFFCYYFFSGNGAFTRLFTTGVFTALGLFTRGGIYYFFILVVGLSFVLTCPAPENTLGTTVF